MAVASIVPEYGFPLPPEPELTPEDVIARAEAIAVRHGERIERLWRDLTMLNGHAGIAVFLNTMANREYAKARFNVEDHC